jgi:chemotaxis receptor (MCP) glutamine deamidase CheD
LNDGGFLILGKTERLNGQKTFKLVDPTNHIYVKGELPNLKEGNEKRIQRLKDLANLETRINDKIMDKYKTISLQEKDDDLQPSEISIKKESPEEEPDKEIIKSNPIKKPKNLINISNILSKPSKSEIYEQQIAELEKFRTRINKELFFLKQQRKKLNEAILKFEEEKKEFQEQKKDFENTLLLFEKERRFIKKKWESYEMKNELLRIEKEMFKKQVEKFQHKIKNFEKYKNRKGSSENHISEAKVLKYGYKEEDHILPLGQYVISSSKDNSKHIPKKISINGIGSTYILILCDNLNQIYAMSHIMYLKPRKGQKKDELTNKHQYAQFCVPFLTKKMLINGASEKLTACIIGGAQIFNKKYNSVERILEKLKLELKKYNISIQKEHIGGAYPRDIKLNIKKKRILIQFGSNKKEIKL